MRTVVSGLVILGMVVCAIVDPLPSEASKLRQSPVVKAVETASPAVVNINTEQTTNIQNPFKGFGEGSIFEDFFRDFLPQFPNNRTSTSLGSGVIIDKKGLILTNQHVIQGATKIRVSLADGREFSARLIGADPPSDLAVLRIEAEESLPEIPMGQSGDLMIGETVIAIGNPFGLSHTVTTGVISAVNRSFQTEKRIYNDFIQTDAAINPGNSGGPLLNIDGELIGINTSIYQKAQGVGFAIPIDRARRIIHDLVQYGEVQPAYIGLDVQDLTAQLREYFHLQGESGVLVAHVTPGGPADRAGLEKGDLVTSLGRTRVSSEGEFQQALSGYTADSDIPVKFVRDGRRKSIKIKAAKLSTDEAVQDASERIGIRVGELTPKLRNQYGIRVQNGVVVVDIYPRSMAVRAGMRQGDVILQINDRDILNMDGYNKAMATALRRKNMLMLIQRGTSGYYLTLELGGT